MTPANVIAEIRRLAQDSGTSYRYSDVFLLAIVNQAIKRLSLMRPDLFAYIGTVACTAGTVVQSAPSDSIRIIEVHSIVGGNGLIEAEKVVLDQTAPGWVNDTAGAAVNWMRHIRNPNKFFIYPKAPSAQTLSVEYAQAPSDYASGATVSLLSDAYMPVLVDISMFLVESVDNENVLQGRAKLFHESFVQMLGLATQSRVVLDTETGGLGVEKVV